MPDNDQSAYAAAGVDIEAGNRTVEMIRQAVQATYTPQVLSDVGSFGGLYDASPLTAMERPVLVASTDGVGTKTMVAAKMSLWDGIGADLVHHCINDILVQGAAPLFFLDYVASSRLNPEVVTAIVTGMAEACAAAGVALLGGETAEMPGVYYEGETDIVGTVVGAVDRSTLITGENITAGDGLLGFPSSGLHTNGFTLARRALAGEEWDTPHPDLDGRSIGQTLLEPHRAYLPHVDKLRAAEVQIKGLAHITGGGLVDNLPRILPEGLGARIVSAAWQVPPIFTLIRQQAKVSPAEMFRVFNMGIGMVAVIPPGQVPVAVEALTDEGAMLIGEVVSGAGVTIR